MSTTTVPASTDAPVTVQFDEESANTVVESVALALLGKGEQLNNCALSRTPGDLFRIAECSERIARLSAVNKQLKWRAHWGPMGGGAPPAVTATVSTWLEIALLLFEEQEEYETAKRAGRIIAAAVAEES